MKRPVRCLVRGFEKGARGVCRSGMVCCSCSGRGAGGSGRAPTPTALEPPRADGNESVKIGALKKSGSLFNSHETRALV